MNIRIFMAGKSDKAYLTFIARLNHRLDSAPRGKNAVDILIPDNFMQLPQVEVIDLQALQALIEPVFSQHLSCGRRPSS